jgi:hypothetical protein
MILRVPRTVWRGVSTAVRARPVLLLAIAAGVLVLDLVLPPLVLSLTRKPWTYFAVNPWLKTLPTYLGSSAPLSQKVDFLSRVALFWITAEGAYGAPEWGFAVDTMDLARFLLMSLLVGTYFALWLYCRERGWRGAAPRNGGVVGALAGALGLSTGPCSVMGCGAPVLPVVGLMFAGLSSGTLTALSVLSRVSAALVLTALVAGVVYLGWRAGSLAEPAR